MTQCPRKRPDHWLAWTGGALTLALLLLPRSAAAQMTTGSYVGNGAAGRKITGLGFRPDIVIVKGNDSDGTFTPTSTILRSSTMVGDSSKPMVLDNALVGNEVQSLDVDGFTVGSERRVNQSGVTFYWAAFKVDADMKVGTYTGNGGAQSITGLGFSPEYVIVMSSANRRAVHAASPAPAGRSFEFESAGWLANQITSLDATGFSVVHNGAAPYANENLVLYHYVAWNDAPLKTRIGSYAGNGADNRNITGIGFQPEYLIVKAIYNNNVLPNLTPPGHQRYAQMVGDATYNFAVGPGTDLLQALQVDGFQVGAGLSTNRAFADCNLDGPGCSYFYVAFNQVCPTCPPLGVTQGAGTITVTAPNSFELRFSTAFGGGIDRLFDLAEDPAKTYDLAGGVNDLSALFDFEIAPNGGAFAGVNHATDRNSSGSKIDVLEATPARVRVRQDAFFQQQGGANILGGIKGVGDYSIYGGGRTAVRWTETDSNTPLFVYARRQIGMAAHYTAGAPLNSYTPCHDSACNASGGAGTGQVDFVLGVRNVANARTDFLTILSQDWAQATSIEFLADATAGQEYSDQVWQHVGAGSVASQSWNLLTYFKPTNLGSGASPWLDPTVTTRNTDFRAPDPLAAIGPGAGWNENPADADFFNESEAAYTLDLDPAGGLAFDMNGVATTRYTPFFKIRQWRSFVEAPVVSLEGTSLAKNVDYRAAAKPVTRAHLSEESWYSTFQSSAATSTPAVGTTTSVSGGITFLAGRYGNGAQIDANGDTITFPAASNFDPFFGAVELWYKPSYTCRTAPSTCDGTRHVLWHMQQVATDYFILEKTAANNLEFRVSKGGVLTTKQVALGAFGWGANDWVHLRVTWDETSPIVAEKLLIYVNGARPTQGISGATFSAAGLVVGPSYIGTDSTGSNHASGVLDEFHMYTAESLPTPLAHGGLTSNGEEYLADGTRNADLLELPIDAQKRGQYLCFGSDSKMRGLNVALTTAGTGVAAGDVDWEYWNGSSWADLETGFGFTDQTQSFTKNGTVYWTSDPTGWAPYSVNGGPDLYYLRAHLKSTSPGYGVRPRESRIVTDILLLQYCADITTANQTFVFGPPPPTTEVKLQSFDAVPGDRSVLLEWRTASELSNLGFHVYRSLSNAGPWTRLTSSLIPGLGSSAVGQAYSWRDTALSNGTRYFYRLEDVDASSKATSHGPVSAVPLAGAPAGDGGGGDGSAGGGKTKRAAASSCPDWVLSANGSSVGAGAAAFHCTRHGDPESVSLGVLSRDARQATLELRTGGFYALHEASGTVRVFVPGFDLARDAQAAALPIRRALVDAVVGRRVQLGGVRALELAGFKGLVPSALGKAEMELERDGTVRAARRGPRVPPRLFPKSELVTLLPSVFQGETKSAVVEIAPLRYDERRQQLVLAKRVRVRLLFTGREAGESGRGSHGRAPRRRQPAVSGDVLARLFTTSEGLHAVSFDELFPGRRRGLAASELRLERQGEPVGFHLEPVPSSFGPGSRLFFYADTTAGSTAFSSEVAFELVSARDGVAMPLQSAAPGSSLVATPAAVSRSFETNRFYQPGLLDAPDPWLWDALASGATRVESFPLAGVSASGTAELDVFLQGASESGNPVDHHVSVSLNGVPVGDAQFAGKTPYRTSLSLPASLLREGTNDLSLTNVADTGVSSLVFLDRFVLVHPQASSLASGRLEGTWPESGAVSVSGVSGAPVVVDVTAASSPRWLTGWQASGGSLQFQAEAGHRYAVVSDVALLSPRVALPELPGLRSAGNRADYILIAPRAFLTAAEPLLERRADQGLTTRAVAFEEITDGFGHGQASAEAIQIFLGYAFQSWARPSPRYVLLLGDASYDPRNFMGTSPPAPLPALWTKTSYLWTVSDPQLAAVNGDDNVPDLAIGRLPAATVEQAQSLVQKLLAWEDSGQGLSGAATLVVDNPDIAGDFEADARDIAQGYLAGRNPQLLLLSELGTATRPRILDALNGGLSYLSYVGHGGAAVWASENVWNSWDASSLQAQSRQPLLVTMNCLNGYFVAPAFDSLSESLLKAEGRGAIAAFSPSGLSVDGPAHQYHRALMAELTGGAHQRLGDAILAAQATYAQTGLMPELLGVYHLLGDPATVIR